MNKELKIENVSKQFLGKQILNNITYNFSPGKVYCITGASGSGKSTLLNIIGLLIKPDLGKVVYNDNPISNLSRYKKMTYFRDKLGFLYQNYALIDNQTVLDNLKVATKYLKMIDKEAYSNVLKDVGLEGFENRKVFTLSGGEQHRVAMARLMLKNCDIILADEPTGNLDHDNSIQIFNLLSNMKQEKIVIISSHDPLIIEMCDEVIELKK